MLRRGTRRRSTSPRMLAAGALLRSDAIRQLAALKRSPAFKFYFASKGRSFVCTAPSGPAANKLFAGSRYMKLTKQSTGCASKQLAGKSGGAEPGSMHKENLTSEQRFWHRAAVLYLVFFAGLCGGFLAAQQLYLWTESARVQSAALAVRPCATQAVRAAQPKGRLGT